MIGAVLSVLVIAPCFWLGYVGAAWLHRLRNRSRRSAA